VLQHVTVCCSLILMTLFLAVEHRRHEQLISSSRALLLRCQFFFCTSCGSHRQNARHKRPRCLSLTVRYCNTLQHTATHCNAATHCYTLQRTVIHCNRLPKRTAPEASMSLFDCQVLRHTATHCNTLPHTATHCHTLQHTTTHCNTL